MPVLWLIAALVLLGLTLYAVIHPRRINDASWYGSLLESVNLYILPATYLLFTHAAFSLFLESVGQTMPVLVTGVVLAIALPLFFLGMLAFMGMPMPRFLMPKWVHERKVQDRRERRRRRAHNKSEKRSHA